MVGWHHRFNRHKFEQTRGREMVKDREGWSAAVHGGRKESDMT